MSFLRKMFHGDVKEDDQRRFLLEAMLGALAANRGISDEELRPIQQHVASHELFGDLSRESISYLMEIARESIGDGRSDDERIAAIAAPLRDDEHRRAAYRLACDVCVSDERLPESEIRYLESLQKELGISDDDAHKLFEAARARSGLLTLDEKVTKMRALMPRFVEAMVLASIADGVVREEEVASIRAILREVPDMSVLPHNELEKAVEAAYARANEEDYPEAELEAIAAVVTEPVDRFWTTVYMTIVVLADNNADWRQVALLKAVQKIFSFTDAQMDQALQVAQRFPNVALGGKLPGD